VVINDYSRQRGVSATQADELVKYFYKTFHGIDSHTPQSKETSQALSLVSQHGLDKAKAVVDFARSEAIKTNFNIQHFGAVLSYASRALTPVSRGRAAAPTLPVSALVEKQTPLSKPRLARGEARLQALTPEQRQSRLEQAKAELLHSVPFLAERTRAGSKLEESMVRSYLVRQLEHEVMDLLPLQALDLPAGLAQILALQAAENSAATV
jgi:hypothetical protein